MAVSPNDMPEESKSWMFLDSGLMPIAKELLALMRFQALIAHELVVPSAMGLQQDKWGKESAAEVLMS